MASQLSPLQCVFAAFQQVLIGSDLTQIEVLMDQHLILHSSSFNAALPSSEARVMSRERVNLAIAEQLGATKVRDLTVHYAEEAGDRAAGYVTFSVCHHRERLGMPTATTNFPLALHFVAVVRNGQICEWWQRWSIGDALARVGHPGAPREATLAPSTAPSTAPSIGPAWASQWQVTPRQLNVALALAAGASDKEIADRLRISLATVRTHLRGLFRRAGVTNRREFYHKVKSIGVG